LKYNARNIVLDVWWEVAHGFKCLVHEFGHD
jgi:hypothetical protein